MRGFVHERDSISPPRTVRESVRSSTGNSSCVKWFEKKLFAISSGHCKENVIRGICTAVFEIVEQLDFGESTM